jgi:hypothetical protein
MLRSTFTLLFAAASLLSAPAYAQSNAEADLYIVGDTLGNPLLAEVSGSVPNAVTYLMPSFDLAGSNYLVGLSGDPNDFLTVGLGLAQSGTYFTKRADASGRTSFALGLPNAVSLLDRMVHFQAFSAVGASTFEKFSSIATISVNQSNRWQDLADAPVATANLAFVVEDRTPEGGARSIVLCGGGPYLLTDENTPYPTEDRIWRYDTIREEFEILPGRMQDSRAFHNAVRLQDGRIFVCGGVQGPLGTGPYHTAVLRSAEIYDPNTNSWSSAAPMSSFRAGSTANLMPDGRVFVAGGTKGDGQNRLFSVDDLLTTSLRTTEIYDPVSNSWSAGPNMAQPKAGAVSVVLNNGTIMIAGGVTFTTIFGIPIPDFSNQVSFYNPNNGNMTANTMREKRALFGMAKLSDGRVLIAGGAGGDIFNIGPIKKTEIYKPSTGVYTNLASLNTAVVFSGCVALPDGSAVIIGGAMGDLDDPIPVRNAWRFDPNGDTITPLPDMNATHGGHATVFTANGNITVISGESNSGSAAGTSESYSPAG